MKNKRNWGSDHNIRVSVEVYSLSCTADKNKQKATEEELKLPPNKYDTLFSNMNSWTVFLK